MKVENMLLSSVIALAISAGFIQQVDAASIHEVAAFGDVVALQQEIQKGANVDVANKYGSTALMWAYSWNRYL